MKNLISYQTKSDGLALVSFADYAVSHSGNRGVVPVDGGHRAEFAVDALDDFENDFSRRVIERAGGRFVAQQNVGLFGDGAGDGDRRIIARENDSDAPSDRPFPELPPPPLDFGRLAEESLLFRRDKV